MENCSYFDMVPIEVHLKIFKLVSIEDIKNVCVAYNQFKFLLQTEELVRHMDLTHTVDKNFRNWSMFINPLLVTCLNINHCHWVSPRDLRNFVGKFNNLEKLSALRTKLCLCEEDLLVYQKTKIHELVLTVGKGCDGKVGHEIVLPLVKQLGLEFIDLNTCFKVSIFPSIEALWFDTMALGEVPKIGTIYSIIRSSTLKAFWLKANLLSKFNFTEGRIHSRAFYITHSEFAQTMCFVSDDVRHVVESRSQWQYREQYLGGAFEWINGITQALELVQGNIHRPILTPTIKYEGLNFCHKLNCHYGDPVNLSYSLLMSDTAQDVTRLSLSTCVLYPLTISEQPTYEQGVHLFKRQRKGLTCRNAGAHIWNKLSRLRHLELYSCRHDIGLGLYDELWNCIHLRHLHVSIPTHTDGSFLIQVLTNCTNLETLNVTTEGIHEPLNNNLRRALERAPKTLVSFYYKCIKMHLTEILKILQPMSLRTLCLHSRSFYDPLSHLAVEKYLEANQQLRYFSITLPEATEKQRKQMKKTVQRFKSHVCLFAMDDSESALTISAMNNSVGTFFLNNLLDCSM